MYQLGGTVLAPVVAGVAAAKTTTLAFTGFAFGLYLAVAVGLLVMGFVLRRLAMARAH